MEAIDIKKNIATNITKYRKERGLTQKELASKLGVVPSRVSNWENGTNSMDINTLFKICHILSVSINDIYGVYPDADFSLSYDEQTFIKKYRTLDEHGKDMVDVVLEKEFDRCQAVVNGPVVINIGSKAHGGDQYYLFSDTDLPEHLLPKAAHERTDLDHEITDEDRQADLEILKQMKKGK